MNYEHPEDLKELSIHAKCKQIPDPASAETLKYEMNRAASEGYLGVHFYEFWESGNVLPLKEAGYKAMYRNSYFIIWG